nr:hypothetical protein [Tanacetum cinerariifolium]
MLVSQTEEKPDTHYPFATTTCVPAPATIKDLSSASLHYCHICRADVAEKSPLDFADEAEASGRETAASEMPPPEEVPLATVPGSGQAVEAVKSVAQIARQEKRIQDRELEIKNLEVLLEIEAEMKRAAEGKNAELVRELEDIRAQFSGLQVSNEHLSQQVAALQEQVSGEEKLKVAFEEFKWYEDDRVEKRCAELDARLDALSIDFDEELYPHMLTAIAGRRSVPADLARSVSAVLLDRFEQTFARSVPTKILDRIEVSSKSQIELFFVYKDPIFESQDMSTSNTHQESLVDAGSETRHPMLERAKKLDKSHDPLALMAYTGSYSRTTSPYYVTHLSLVVDYNDDYQGDAVQNNSEDPLASAMILLAREITQRFSNPTNNRLRTSSNTKNKTIFQAVRVHIQSRNSGNDGRNTRRSYVQEEVIEGNNVYNDAGNIHRTLRITYSGTVANVQCYNCSEKGVTLTDEHNDFLFVDVTRREEIEELSANICLMAIIQPTNINFDAGLSYDSTLLSKILIVAVLNKNNVQASYALEQLVLNAYKEAEKQQINADKVKQQNKVLTQQLELYKEKIVDSGCLKHITGDRTLLENFIEKFIDTVRFGNDHFAAITGYGDYVQGNITICHVYYVKGLGHNLFSVEIAASSPVCLMSKATSTKSWLWHRRLSHLNFSTINDLTKYDRVDGLLKFKYSKDHLCYACEWEKSNKSSHPPKLVPSINVKLELIYMDLCGPMMVASINEKKYILVIIDDYSRFTWVYFLHTNETSVIIKKFIVQIQLNYNAKQNDNGIEFKNAILKAHYQKLGIMQQLLTARTPQQNGVVKRCIRTLVEVACTMLALLKIDGLGKMKPNAYIGIFIGYSKTSKGFQIYNRRTKNIMETIHVKFDELTTMDFKHDSLELASERFINDDSSVESTNTPYKEDFDILFWPMYKEYFQKRSSDMSINFSAQQVRNHEDSPSTSSIIIEEHDAPLIVTTYEEQTSLISINEDAESSTTALDLSNMHEFHQVQPSTHIWTKAHPLEQVIGDLSKLVMTRKRLQTDLELCMYALTVSTFEPKNIKEAMLDHTWIESMQDKLHQFKRLDVWELVLMRNFF